MPVLVTSTPSLEEQMQELQRKLIEKELKLLILLVALKIESVKKLMRLTIATPLSLREILMETINLMIIQSVRRMEEARRKQRKPKIWSELR